MRRPEAVRQFCRAQSNGSVAPTLIIVVSGGAFQTVPYSEMLLARVTPLLLQ
jgi:hypothetical protein